MSDGDFSTLSDALGVPYDEDFSIDATNEKLMEDFGKMTKIEDEELRKAPSSTLELLQNEVVVIDEKKDSISYQLTTAKIHDVEFLSTEIKSLIVSSKGVLRILERELVLGSTPSMYEVYTKLLNTILAQYKELRQLNEAVAKLILENKKHNLEETKEDHKMILSGNELLDMINDVSNNNSLDSIDTEFELE